MTNYRIFACKRLMVIVGFHSDIQGLGIQGSNEEKHILTYLRLGNKDKFNQMNDSLCVNEVETSLA